MGGKSRKSGGVSKKLIQTLKTFQSQSQQSSNKISDKKSSCVKKPKNDEKGFFD